MTSIPPPPISDRMAGRYCGPRCPHCRAEPGPDCADKSRATRVLRQADRGALRRYVIDELGTEPPDPFVDASDCRHGCNGDCVTNDFPSARCSFTCHTEGA